MTTTPVTEQQLGLLKCLIWDLDETVWSGRLLDGDEPTLNEGVVGVISELDRRGILQSVASANLHEQVWPWLERFGIAEYIVAPEIHLGHKHESVSRIAQRLQLRLRDVAFIDDDPMERELVHALLPEVAVLAAQDYRHLLDDPRFTPAVLTREGRDRRHLVRTELERDEEMHKHGSIVEFLRSCAIRFQGRAATAVDLDRVVELSGRTNRMNATGSHLGTTELTAALARPGRELLVASMSDRFGDYGTVAAAVVELKGTEARTDGLWMSCRAGRRGLPGAFFTFLASRAYCLGANRLTVRYRRSKDNRLAAFHLGTYGFRLTASEGNQVYALSLPDGIRPFDDWLEVAP